MYKTTNIKIILMLIVGIIVGRSNDLFAQRDPILTPESEYYLEPVGSIEGYDFGMTYINIPPPPQHPLGQRWVPQSIVHTAMFIEGCEVMVWVDWMCRRSYSDNPEFFITRLTLSTKNEECKKKIHNYTAQITDFIGFLLTKHASCFHDNEKNIPLCDGDKQFSKAYRLYVNNCGSWHTDPKSFMEYFYPCENNYSYCRLTYSYCWAVVNGELKLVKKIQRVFETPGDNDDELTDEQIKEREYYSCRPYDEETGMDCRNENCRLRKSGYYEGNIKPEFNIPDIDGNPPVGLEAIPCLE